MTLLTFLRFAHEIFKGVVDNVEVGVKKFYVLQRGNANGQVRRREFDFVVVGENARPFFFGAVEKILNCVFEFGVGLAIIPKLQHAIFVAPAEHLVEKFCVNEFENFLEHVDAGIGKNFIFQFADKVGERFVFAQEFVFGNEIFNRAAFAENIFELLSCARDVGDVFKVIRVFAVVERNFFAV